MSQKPTEVLTPVGRLVGGHPMKRDGVTKRNQQTKVDEPVMITDPSTGQQVQATEVYIGIAIPKSGETHWNQTEWGAKLYQAATVGWPGGEYNSQTFAWKITDGDSPIPNKRGKKPCDREGYPGHWVLNCSTRFFVKCFHAGKYDPAQQIQNEKEMKPGDYCRVLINAKGNGPSESPGIYLNPVLFELTRAGVEIQLGDGPSAAEAFGTQQGQLPANAQIDQAVTPPPGNVTPPPPVNNVAPPPPPVNNVAPPPPPAEPVKQMTEKAGGATYDQMIASGWNDQLLIEHGMMIVTAPGTVPNTGFVNGQ
jgi:hypothetical protein